MATPPLAPLHLKQRPSEGLYARHAPILEPDEFTPDSTDAWRAATPIRPDTAHVQAPHFLDFAGDLVSGVLIIAGGVFAYGFVHLA